MGSNSFCFKVCDPAGPNAAALCQHIYDRIGVSYNCPSAAQNGTFEVCDSDNQDPPGIYTDASGAVQTYSQPPESLGVISTLPYTPKVPSSSNCVQYASTALFTDLVAPTSAPTGTASGASATGKASGSGAAGTASRSGASAGASSTGAASGSNGAAAVRISVIATFAGVLGAVAFLA